MRLRVRHRKNQMAEDERKRKREAERKKMRETKKASGKKKGTENRDEGHWKVER